MSVTMMMVTSTLTAMARWMPLSNIARLAAIALRIGAPMVALTCRVRVVRPVASPWSESGRPEVAVTV